MQDIIIDVRCEWTINSQINESRCLLQHHYLQTFYLSLRSSSFSDAFSCSLSAAITITATSTCRLSERSLSATSRLSWARCCECARSHSSSVSVWASSVLTLASRRCMVLSAARRKWARRRRTAAEAAAVSKPEYEV